MPRFLLWHRHGPVSSASQLKTLSPGKGVMSAPLRKATGSPASKWQRLAAVRDSQPQPPRLASQELKGLQELVLSASPKKYQVWLLDQFGVLHDGQKPYPGAVDALQRLADSGAKLILISNSSKRASVTMAKLEPLGFDPSLFVGAITSGELTHMALQTRSDPWFANLGRRCLHMTWNARGSVSLQGLGLEVVEDVERADFILAHGTEAVARAQEQQVQAEAQAQVEVEVGAGAGAASSLGVRAATLPQLREILAQAAPRGVPLVVANPDLVTVEARALRVMPGNLGLWYEEMGGEVVYMGKPDKRVYREALAMAGLPTTSVEAVIAVGDSLHHDVDGAAGVGIDTLFIAGGIHADELGISELGAAPSLESLVKLLQTHSHPTYILPIFRW